MDSSQEIAILHPAEGLGDSLAISTIPERIVRELQRKVYIQEPHWRNQGIKQLWERNPFVAGFTHEAANFIPTLEITSQYLKYENHIKAREAMYGFEPKNLYPKLYNVNYKYLPNVAGKILIDSKSVAVQYSADSFEKFINRLKEHGIIKSIDDCLIVDAKVNEGHLPTSLEFPKFLENYPKFYSDNIFEYINAIFSCSAFICCVSGSSMLASAIKRNSPYPQIHGLMSTAQWNQKIWIVPGINVYMNGANYDDWKLF